MTANIVGTATDKHLRTTLSPLIMTSWDARKKMAAQMEVRIADYNSNPWTDVLMKKRMVRRIPSAMS